jgi:hypothetical protein
MFLKWTRPYAPIEREYILYGSEPAWGYRFNKLTKEPVMSDLTNPIFHDETEARRHVEALRWADGRYCPHCVLRMKPAPLRARTAPAFTTATLVRRRSPRQSGPSSSGPTFPYTSGWPLRTCFAHPRRACPRTGCSVLLTSPRGSWPIAFGKR